MRGRARKSTERIRNGDVERRNRSHKSPHYALARPGEPIIERHRAGPSYRQVLLKRDVEVFLSLLPEWPELSKGIQAVLLTAGDPEYLGWYQTGAVAVCAWDRDISGLWTRRFVDQNQDVLGRLEVETEPRDGKTVFVDWDERSVKAYQLMHVLLPEIGLHHDQMATRTRIESSRGKQYCAHYASEHGEAIWNAYLDAFDW